MVNLEKTFASLANLLSRVTVDSKECPHPPGLGRALFPTTGERGISWQTFRWERTLAGAGSKPSCCNGACTTHEFTTHCFFG